MQKFKVPVYPVLYGEVMFAMVHRSDQDMSDTHSPRRRLYPPASKPCGFRLKEAGSGAGGRGRL